MDRKSRKWHGKWIWIDNNGLEENTYHYFRKEFEYKDKGETKIWISAIKKYRLYVNGIYIGEGPPLSQEYNQYYDEYDISKHLHKGINTIAVIVHYINWGDYNRGALLLECCKGKEVLLASDDEFKVIKSSSWAKKTGRSNDVVGYEEVYDARKEPVGWKDEGFDDRKWAYAKIIKGRYDDIPPAVYPWIYLMKRDIPFMRQKEILPKEIIDVYETVDVEDNNQISKQMSMDITVPISKSVIENEESILNNNSCVFLRNSTKHLNKDIWFDKIYNPCLVLDMGEITSAYIELQVDTEAGTIIDMAYSERLVEGKFISTVTEIGFADRYITNKGVQTFKSFYWKSFRYIKIKVRNCFTGIKIKQLKALSSNYPFDYSGKFNCDDDFYNILWKNCRKTIELCSNEFIMDTPWREQRQWLGDVSAVTLGGIYSAFGPEKLTSKYLYQCGNGQYPSGIVSMIGNVNEPGKWHSREIIDYSLWWIKGLYENYMYYGNEDVINTHYPHILKILQFFEKTRRINGLVYDVGLWTFIDWTDIDKKGNCAALNAIYYGMLKYVIKIAKLRKDEYIIEKCKLIRSEIKEKYNKLLWDPIKGVYVDSYYNGERSKKVSELTNMLAILYKLADHKKINAVIRNIYEDKKLKVTEAEPFGTYFVLEALVVNQKINICLEIIKQRWGRMIRRGATTIWEEWGIYGSWRKGSEYYSRWRSLSHAWSTAPLEFLSKKLTGFEIIEPGCKIVKIKPLNCSIENYEIIIPTPIGNISVIKKDGDYTIDKPDTIKIV